MSQCSLENCDNECFENKSECILHLENTFLKNYFEQNINGEDVLIVKKINFLENFNYQIIFDISKSIKFLGCIFNSDKNITLQEYKKVHFYNSTFNKPWKHLNIKDIIYSNCIFNEEITFDINLNNEKNSINQIMMQGCNINKKFDLDFSSENVEECQIETLDLSDSVFHKKVEIKCCNITTCTLTNTRFNALCDFYKTEFHTTIFYKTSFGNISVFTEVAFHEDVNFQFTTFEKLTLFRKTIFVKSVNLIDSIIKEEANFLGIESDNGKLKKENIKNRETARIIKNSFEKENNIIEANKFYAIEMKKMENELSFFDTSQWFIFKIHGISSDHSQSWLKSLMWIFIIALLYNSLKYMCNAPSINNINLILMIGSIFMVSIYNLSFYKNIIYLNFSKYMIAILFFANYIYLTKDYNLENMANSINPFSVMTDWEEISFLALVLKVIISYLIYQFIVSVRQNTRRK